ncbi:hypothetical protein [Nocardia sp. N2S4-5]|uniref:hypothetical protein n=1 Tax=Nocardia sp. N2S4-5 TaxID=3351565 RepID=UPI0037D95987
MNSEVAAVLSILTQVRAVVTSGPQDLTWQSRYADEPEILDDLADHAARLQHEDYSRLPDLSILFAATGPLCEIAVSSGWMHTYRTLADQLDPLLARLRQS